jgi:Ca-activated chloride channel homolog
MNNENENLEKNISRLVKLAGDSNQPNKAFTDSLVNKAIDELSQPAASQRKNKTMISKTILKIFAYAASILIVCGVLIAVMMQDRTSVKRGIGNLPVRGQDKTIAMEQKLKDAATPLPSAESENIPAVAKEAPIEYTQGGIAATRATTAEKSKLAESPQIPVMQPSETKIAELIANAEYFKNRQRYDDALKQLAMALSMDPNNIEILNLKESVDGSKKQVALLMKTKGDRLDEKTHGGVYYEESFDDESSARDSLSISAKPAEKKLYDKSEMRSSSSGEAAAGALGYSYAKGVRGYEVAQEARCMPYPPPCKPMPPYCPQPPMANGGSVPPNGEDIDAMFFKNYGVNPFIDTEDDHLSTFAMDVDTASYTLARAYLHDGHMPSNDAVRVEEFVNFFKYNYPAPKKDDFALYSEASPWQFGKNRNNSYLLRLGLKARNISEENRKPAILTFVIDVSGSMQREDRLGLVKKSLRLLIDNLKPDDRIGIAVYQTRGRKVMDYKGLVEKDDILAAIDSLSAEGSTNAEEGIRIGYEMAERAFRPGCINRVILCTDGVANEGQTAAEDILKEIKEKADKGITLSAIGFGMGNYNDVLLEKLGDKGNGHYAYVDTITEARRIFVENLTGTLQLIAKDAKIQVDFNPDVVRSYRLIGYENRDVPDEKFRDDKYNGGQVGAGHSVTAIYEIKMWPEKKGKIATTYVRYKKADSGEVTEFKSEFNSSQMNRSFDSSSKQFRLAATVTEFAEILRNSYWARGATLDPVLQQAQTLAGEYKGDSDVIEFVDLVSKAQKLMLKSVPQPAEDSHNE